MSLTTEDIDAVCGLVDELCGIYLDESKGYLIESRLGDLVQRNGCESYAELARRAKTATGRGLQEEIVNAITTNETLWFRDGTPFDALRYKILPELIDAKSKTTSPRDIRIWSAACSTGQEAYSIAMAFADIVDDFDRWNLQIYGSDVSSEAVAKAQAGVYSDLEISRGLDQLHKSAYFVQDGGAWRVNESLASKCKFQVRNLLGSLLGVGPFDIIFCRNVAIYFDNDDRQKLFSNLGKALNPDGWLFLGSSESMTGLGDEWKMYRHCRSACYQWNPALAAV